jgi:hypothetical protein
MQFIFLLLGISCIAGSAELAQQLENDLRIIATKMYEIPQEMAISTRDLSNLILELSEASMLLSPVGRVTDEELTTTSMLNSMNLMITNTYDFFVFGIKQEQLYDTHRILAYAVIAQIYQRLYTAQSTADYIEFVADTTIIFYDPPPHTFTVEDEDADEDYGEVFPIEVENVLSLHQYYVTYFMTELVTDEEPALKCRDMDKDELATRLLYWSNALQVVNYELLASTPSFSARNYRGEMFVSGLPNTLQHIHNCLHLVTGDPLAASLKQYVADFYTYHFTTDPTGKAQVKQRLLAFTIDTILPALASFVYRPQQ